MNIRTLILVHILIITGYSYGQKLSFDYAMGEKDIEVFMENDLIYYNYQTEAFQYQNVFMNADSLMISDKAPVLYSKNTLEINGKKYKFKKPMFSRKAYLVDQTNNKKLIQFEALYKENKIEINLTDHFQAIKDADIQEKLKLWAFFKETKYVYYNGSTRSEPKNYASAGVIGFIAGIFSNL